jgi:hypothetical protein
MPNRPRVYQRRKQLAAKKRFVNNATVKKVSSVVTITPM